MIMSLLFLESERAREKFVVGIKQKIEKKKNSFLSLSLLFFFWSIGCRDSFLAESRTTTCQITFQRLRRKRRWVLGVLYAGENVFFKPECLDTVVCSSAVHRYRKHGTKEREKKTEPRSCRMAWPAASEEEHRPFALFFSFFFFFYRCKPCSALYTPAETQNDGRVRAIYFRTYGQHMFPLGPVNIRITKMVRTLPLYLLLKLLTF